MPEGATGSLEGIWGAPIGDVASMHRSRDSDAAGPQLYHLHDHGHAIALWCPCHGNRLKPGF